MAVLRHNGLEPVVRKRGGSHTETYRDPERPERVTTVPAYGEFQGQLLRDIIREAGKTREEFLERLSEL